MLNSHWLLEREFVADERSGSLDVDTLGYSSSGGGHWPLTGVGYLPVGYARHNTAQLER